MQPPSGLYKAHTILQLVNNVSHLSSPTVLQMVRFVNGDPPYAYLLVFRTFMKIVSVPYIDLQW